MNNLRKFNIFIEERGFLSHITLARKGRTGLRIDREDLMNFTISVKMDFSKIIVFESKLSRQGAVYNSLAEWELGKRSRVKINND